MLLLMMMVQWWWLFTSNSTCELHWHKFGKRYLKLQVLIIGNLHQRNTNLWWKPLRRRIYMWIIIYFYFLIKEFLRIKKNNNNLVVTFNFNVKLPNSIFVAIMLNQKKYLKNLNINMLININIEKFGMCVWMRKQNLIAGLHTYKIHITKIWKENVKLKYIVTINVS